MAAITFSSLRLYVIPLMLVILDQMSKWLMLELIFTPPRVINLLPFLNLSPVWNRGVSFGLLDDAGAWSPLVLTVLALAVAAALPIVARQWDKLSRMGAMMMAGGAAGNGIDRIIHGKVVDFIDFFVGQWHWPAFNVADMAIIVGAGLIILGSIFSGQANNKASN